MRILQHDRALGRQDYEEWPALVDGPLAPAVSNDCWGGTGGGDYPGSFGAELSGAPGDGGPDYRYYVELDATDIGEILRVMPVCAVATVLRQLLHQGDPEVVGALVGQIIAHLAANRRGGV